MVCRFKAASINISAALWAEIEMQIHLEKAQNGQSNLKKMLRLPHFQNCRK
jgi:hypothetical protein